MPTGDQEDIARRMHRVLPAGWFPPSLDDAPRLRAVLAMGGRLGAWCYDFLAYARQQTRLATASGGWLDLAALDFFGARLQRRAGQSDAALLARIRAELLRPRATRPALRRLLLDLTGREPLIIEPTRPQDTGGWGVPVMGYGRAGHYGSLLLPGAVLVDVFRDGTAGGGGLTGWGVPAGGYGVGRLAWLSAEQAADAITDDDLRDAILANKPEGVTVWVRIQA